MADTRKRSTAKRKSTTKKKAEAKRPAAKKSSAKKSSARSKSSSTKSPAAEHAPVCTVSFCPICQAAKASQGAGPEALGHLLAAAREFFLAARVVMEAMPKDPAAWRPGSGGEGAKAANGNGSASKGSRLKKISVT